MAQEVLPTLVSLAGDEFIGNFNALVLEVLYHFAEVLWIFSLDETEDIGELLAVRIADTIYETFYIWMHRISSCRVDGHPPCTYHVSHGT
jgi:hypothetical protein